MEDISKNFEKIYNGMKKSDKEIVNKILEEVKKYDVCDIIAKLSALMLIPENQNKATIIEPIIAAILTLPENDLKSEYKISIKKFKKIIQEIENMEMIKAIDPPENTFIDRVMFYGNYYIFPGINHIPGYILQELIKTLYLNNIKFNVEFTQKSSLFIKLILEISNIMAERINVNINNLKRYEMISNIIIPSESELEILKEAVIIDEKIIKYFLAEESLINSLYSNFEKERIEEVLKLDNQKFFNKPFLKNKEGNAIVLSPSILVPFLVHHIINLSEEYGEKENLIDTYNNIVWRNCIKNFYYLNNKKIKEESLNVKLENTNSYKEVLLSGDNKQVIVVIGVFDDGKKWNSQKVFDRSINKGMEKILNKRIEYIIETLKEKIKNEDIYVCIIYHSFGRSMLIGVGETSSYRAICLNPFELECISKNERNQRFFLTRYIKAKNKLLKVPQLFGELPFVDVYTNSNYSFYVSDEFKPGNTMLYIPPGNHIEYIIKSLQKEDRHLVQSYDENVLEEVIISDKKRKIYLVDRIDKKNIIISYLVKINKAQIWICSEKVKNSKELNIYNSMIDYISYWIGECSEILGKTEKTERNLSIKINITGNVEEYFYSKDSEKEIKDTLSVNKENNSIILNITPETYQSLNKNTNINEKNLILIILSKLFEINTDDYRLIEEKFFPAQKQKFFSLDFQLIPYLKPITFRTKRMINENDINVLLDQVGNYIISSKKLGYGIVKEEYKSDISLSVVDYLYKLLQEKVNRISPYNFLELLCNDLEEKIYYMMLFQKRHYNDVLCYPEKKNEIWKEFNELQRASQAMKFLIEYIAAEPPNGNEVIGETEYEELLAICSLIIEWAYNGDLFKFKIFNTPIEILKSNRIGLKKEEYNNMGNCMLNARINEFEYNSIGKWNEFLIENKLDSQELDDIFEKENGFTLTEFFKVCNFLILIGDEQEKEFKLLKCKELVIRLEEGLQEIEKVKIEKILKYISLEERNEFIVPPEGFRKEEVYPWRFNRDLSFTRRPLIKRKEDYIWGNRAVFHMIMFTMDLINNGKFKTKSKAMEKYIGKISKARGNAFNDSIFNILKSFSEITVDKNVKKINGKRIFDENNKDLGDIDILYINHAKRQIVIAEVKDFKLSKNPYEIYCEYKKMFEDTETKMCYSTKLKRRVEWARNHIEDLKKQYSLDDGEWKIYKTFIVNEHLVSRDVYNKDENIIAISEISLKTLTNLKLYN